MLPVQCPLLRCYNEVNFNPNWAKVTCTGYRKLAVMVFTNVRQIFTDVELKRGVVVAERHPSRLSERQQVAFLQKQLFSVQVIYWVRFLYRNGSLTSSLQMFSAVSWQTSRATLTPTDCIDTVDSAPSFSSLFLDAHWFFLTHFVSEEERDDNYKLSLVSGEPFSSQTLPTDLCRSFPSRSRDLIITVNLRSIRRFCFVIGSNVVGAHEILVGLSFLAHWKTNLCELFISVLFSSRMCCCSSSKVSRCILIAPQSPWIYGRSTKWFDLNGAALLPFHIKTFMFPFFFFFFFFYFFAGFCLTAEKVWWSEFPKEKCSFSYCFSNTPAKVNWFYFILIGLTESWTINPMRGTYIFKNFLHTNQYVR